MRKFSLLVLLMCASLFGLELRAQDKQKGDPKVEVLEAKINALESSTDRILNAIYATLGLILTTVIGLNVWTWVGQNRQNRSFIENEALKLKEEVNKLVDGKMKALPLNDIWQIKSTLAKIEKELLVAEIMQLEQLLNKYIRTYYHELDTDDLMKLLRLSIQYSKDNYGDFHIRNSLEGWVNYLKNENSVSDTVKDELMKILSDKKFDEFSSTEQILRMLKDKPSF